MKTNNENDFNFILVDWSKGSKVFNYALAASNTQVVGALIAQFVENICKTYSDKDYSNDKFILIGHSLGSHTMGFAGKRLRNPMVARIIGLDPAGPSFRDSKGDYRLDYWDASQVLVIHTDMAEWVSKGLGIHEPIGDIDFYPNGGKSQPGCIESEVLDNIMKSIVVDSNRDLSCSHNRAPALLYSADNINSPCLPVGYYCKDYETFLEGRCASCGFVNNGLKSCYLMGLFPAIWDDVVINKQNYNKNRYFLNTGKRDRLCIFHYQMAFHITSDSDKNIYEQQIAIKVKALIDRKERLLIFQRTLTKAFPGSIQTTLITFKQNIVDILTVSIEWLKNEESKREYHNFKLGIDFIEIKYMSHIKAKVRKDRAELLCPKNDKWIEYDSKNTLFVDCEEDVKPRVSVLELDSSDLIPFTARNDITSIDFDNEENVAKKIVAKKVKNYRIFSKIGENG